MLNEANSNETNVGAPLAGALNNLVAADDLEQPAGSNRAGASPAPTKSKPVGDIVGAYKSLVAKKCLEIYVQKYPGKIMGKLWQGNYHEHIIRDEIDLQNKTNYIDANPRLWNTDDNNPNI